MAARPANDVSALVRPVDIGPGGDVRDLALQSTHYGRPHRFQRKEMRSIG